MSFFHDSILYLIESILNGFPFHGLIDICLYMKIEIGHEQFPEWKSLISFELNPSWAMISSCTAFVAVAVSAIVVGFPKMERISPIENSQV